MKLKIEGAGNPELAEAEGRWYNTKARLQSKVEGLQEELAKAKAELARLKEVSSGDQNGNEVLKTLMLKQQQSLHKAEQQLEKARTEHIDLRTKLKELKEKKVAEAKE